jgi:hypothetical protein
VVRTWGPRGTLHLLPAADLDWMVPLFGQPAIKAESARQRELGLDASKLRRGVEVIVQALDQGPQERAALRRALAEAGLPYEGQATIHVIAQAGREGRLCYGEEHGKEPAFVLLEDWLGRQTPSRAGEASLAELARRYLRAYAPAGERDLAAWSGIGARAARQALERIAGEMVQVEAAGGPALVLQEQLEWLYAEARRKGNAPALRLLPAFDTYLLGYQDRSLALEPRYSRRVNRGGGWIRPTMLVDGRVAGTWSHRKRGRRIEIELAAFEPLSKDVMQAFTGLGEAVKRFLGYNTP